MTVRIAPAAELGDDCAARAAPETFMRITTGLICSLSLFLTAGLTTACGSSSEGDEGLVSFTPLDCGRTACNFDDAIGVGGKLALHIVGTEDVSTIGLDVRPSDATKLTVTGIPDVGSRPTWELSAVAAGEVDLEVIRPDSEGGDPEVIDTLTINVVAVAQLGLENFIGDAVGPTTAAGFDEVWTVNAGDPVSFRVTAFADATTVTMGRYEYTVTLDAGLEAELIDSNLSEGRLYVNPMAGSWSAEWMGGGRTLTAQIVAQ